MLLRFVSSASSTSSAGPLEWFRPCDELIEAARGSGCRAGQDSITSGTDDLGVARVWEPWKANRSVALYETISLLPSHNSRHHYGR